MQAFNQSGIEDGASSRIAQPLLGLRAQTHAAIRRVISTTRFFSVRLITVPMYNSGQTRPRTLVPLSQFA
jgi:hypothetical protein